LSIAARGGTVVGRGGTVVDRGGTVVDRGGFASLSSAAPEFAVLPLNS
jgi:hypothetical protein